MADPGMQKEETKGDSSLSSDVSNPQEGKTEPAIIADSETFINLRVNWQEIEFNVDLPLNATVGQLKKQLHEFSSIPLPKIHLKTNWPSTSNDETLLASLDLTKPIQLEERKTSSFTNYLPVEDEVEGEEEDNTGININLQTQEQFVALLDSLPKRNFEEEFEKSYGTTHPKVFQGTCKEAVSRVKRDFVPLVIYLHNESDEGTAAFCL